MRNNFLFIIIGFLSVFVLNACVANQSKNYNSSQVSSNTKKAKTKKSKRDPQRNSVNHQAENSIAVSNLGTDDDSPKEVGNNRVSKLESKCSLKGQCVQLIQYKIINLWQYPRSYPKYKTILVLDLTQQGYITTIKLKRSSGVRAFDDSVIKAVRKAAPFTEITYLSSNDIAEFSSIEMVFKR